MLLDILDCLTTQGAEAQVLDRLVRQRLQYKSQQETMGCIKDYLADLHDQQLD